MLILLRLQLAFVVLLHSTGDMISQTNVSINPCAYSIPVPLSTKSSHPTQCLHIRVTLETAGFNDWLSRRLLVLLSCFLVVHCVFTSTSRITRLLPCVTVNHHFLDSSEQFNLNLRRAPSRSERTLKTRATFGRTNVVLFAILSLLVSDTYLCKCVNTDWKHWLRTKESRRPDSRIKWWSDDHANHQAASFFTQQWCLRNFTHLRNRAPSLQSYLVDNFRASFSYCQSSAQPFIRRQSSFPTAANLVGKRQIPVQGRQTEHWIAWKLEIY